MMRPLVLASTLAVLAVLACGPAVPSGGARTDSGVSSLVPGVSSLPQESGDGSSDGEKPVPTATPTRDPECFGVKHPNEDRMVEMCPPPGPKNVEPALREKYNDHMKERTTKQAREETADPVMVKIFVAVETDGAVDAVVQFLNDNGARLVSWSKEGDTTAGGGISAVVDLQLLLAIGEIEGVQSV